MPVIQTSERPQLSLNVASPNTSCNQHKNTNRALKKRVKATKPSGMRGGGRGSKGQRATVNRHICQEIFSAFTSPSGVLSYKGSPVQWKYKHSAHATRWNPNKDLIGHRAIKDALNHRS